MSYEGLTSENVSATYFILSQKIMSKRKAPDSDNNLNNDFCEFLTGDFIIVI